MKARPLIVSDCDGVLLHFIAPFVDYLREVHGLTLSMDSFALTGNMKRPDGSAVEPKEFPPLLDGFFADWMHNQHPIIGAAVSLGQLAKDCDVVVLTNIADHHAERRTLELARLGMPYRVIGNQGGKGAPIQKLLDEFQPTEAIFIDDLTETTGQRIEHAISHEHPKEGTNERRTNQATQYRRWLVNRAHGLNHTQHASHNTQRWQRAGDGRQCALILQFVMVVGLDGALHHIIDRIRIKVIS